MQSGEEEGGDEDEVSCRSPLESPDTTLVSGKRFVETMLTEPEPWP
jgi:hypothetical protein